MADANMLGMIGPLALLAVLGLNLLLLRGAWGRLGPALLGPRAVSTLVQSRPDGECAVLAFPVRASDERRAAGGVPLRLAA